MTFDGFTFLAMGFTGKRAAQFKEAYIKEFNRMREALQPPSAQQPIVTPAKTVEIDLSRRGLLTQIKQIVNVALEIDDERALLEQRVDLGTSEPVLMGTNSPFAEVPG